MYELFETVLAAKYNYWAFTILMMIGVWAMIGKNNLVKKVVGMNIFQTSIILFYVSIGSKKGATIPILMHGHGGETLAINAADYINPLPHVLMLTAIVVSVATLGMALALLLNIYKEHKTLEEDEILKHLSE